MNPVLSLLTFFTDQPWTIPLIGILAASLAFMVGRRWLVVRSAGVPETPAVETTSNLVTAAMAKKSEPDRRSAPRRKGNRVEVYLTDSSKRPPILGWVVDRSMGGLCLIVEQPVKEGTVLNVRPRQAPQTAPWTAIEIRSCRADGGEWEIGCRFLKPPQWNDLLLFGGEVCGFFVLTHPRGETTIPPFRAGALRRGVCSLECWRIARKREGKCEGAGCEDVGGCQYGGSAWSAACWRGV